MNNERRGADIDNQNAILAGIHDNQIYVVPTREYDPHSLPLPTEPRATADRSILLLQQLPINARLDGVRDFAQGFDQRFSNGVNTATLATQDDFCRHAVTHLAPSPDQSSQFTDYNTGQFNNDGSASHYGPTWEYPGDAGVWTSDNGSVVDSNTLAHATAVNNFTGQEHESSNSRLNAKAPPFSPAITVSPPCPDDSFGTFESPTAPPYQNAPVSTGNVFYQASGQQSWVLQRPINASPLLDTYTQSIDITGLSHARLNSYSPQSASVQSEAENTCFSWQSHPGFGTFPSATASTSLQRSPSTRSRATDFSIGHAPPLSRTISCQTDLGYDSNGRVIVSAPRRGVRSGRLDPKKNKKAQHTRFSKTVCTRCKLHKITCERREDSEPCVPCQEKGFTCANHFFFHDLKVSPKYHFGLFLINSPMCLIVWFFLPYTVDFTRSLDVLALLSQTYNIRIRSGDESYELDLAACIRHVEQARRSYGDLPVAVEDFVTDKQRWQDTSWGDLLCRSTQTEWNDCLEAFLCLDRLAGRENFYLVHKLDGRVMEKLLNVEVDTERDLYVISALTLWRLRHQMELAGYSYLEKELSKGRKDTRIINLLGQALLSLRRRISICKTTQIWKRFQYGPLAQHLGQFGQAMIEPPAVRRVEEFCWQLWVHFFFRVAQMKSPEMRSNMERSVSMTKLIPHPWKQAQIMEYFPTGEEGSRDAFNRWMAEGERLFARPVTFSESFGPYFLQNGGDTFDF